MLDYRIPGERKLNDELSRLSRVLGAGGSNFILTIRFYILIKLLEVKRKFN